ncbi:UDP-N-acetylglucosamine 2-epimerase (non-hydrolyzing) [Methanoculleus sp. FWC-SCC1]|uniref:UDP-N-acetylglucosamine 2-epimerase (Non-hydrolyzing) n=1 Tax=Methanoculleus frigidifontis TaxID=2584085 RepID=A0ABT8MBW4_9EURY|nr:UDP-N-acetylglucosamine 2-epimerase (non-hydrolyzing) [Methanoculleus sp. FWC-SCC1]MDN7025428.1 UDP-N-acetylglucosamine 2-epimerase (non-hydrolyzing) [Methanoculleus sp. FWC-SCC1]
MKIVSVVGARPQFVKCAPVSRDLRRRHDEVLVHTGQHYDHGMSAVFFAELAIPKPDYNLAVGSGSHGRQTGAMLAAIEDVLIKEEPDLVLVYGDTNSTLAGSLAAAKLHIPAAHVEAGLRSFDRTMPEEINRVVSDHVADLLFCPTGTAVANLRSEGVTAGVHLVGDVMLDALLYNRTIAEERSQILETLDLAAGGYCVATVHRQSNTDDRRALTRLVDAFAALAEPLVFPVHPRTVKFLREFNLYDRLASASHVRLIEPLGYLDMLQVLAHARLVLTDSGGVQKEAYMLEVPCITLRENTEWVETVEDGWNTLVGTDTAAIIAAASEFAPAGGQRAVFGDGNASRKIAEIISNLE